MVFNRSKMQKQAGELFKKSEGILEAGKIKLRLSSLDNEIYKLKAELGDLVFVDYVKETDEREKREELCRVILEMENEKEDLESQLEQNKK